MKNIKKKYFKVPSKIFDLKLDNNTLALYVFLHFSANSKKEIYGTRKYFADEIGIGINTIVKAFQNLKKLGLIEEFIELGKPTTIYLKNID